MNKMNNITIIGAGTMGNGIAHTFAQKNFNVKLVDISKKSLDKAPLNVGILAAISLSCSTLSSFKNK